MLEDLNQKCEASLQTDRPITLQAVLTKADILMKSAKNPRNDISKMQQEIFEAAPLCLPPILTASSKVLQLGWSEVRQSIVDACGVGRANARVILSGGNSSSTPEAACSPSGRSSKKRE